MWQVLLPNVARDSEAQGDIGQGTQCQEEKRFIMEEEMLKTSCLESAWDWHIPFHGTLIINL